MGAGRHRLSDGHDLVGRRTAFGGLGGCDHDRAQTDGDRCGVDDTNVGIHRIGSGDRRLHRGRQGGADVDAHDGGGAGVEMTLKRFSEPAG